VSRSHLSNPLTSRSSTAAAPILAVLAIVLVILGTYVGGYFWLADTRSPRNDSTVVTRFYRPSLKPIFAPAARVDAILTGRHVRIRWVTEDDFEDDSGDPPRP
jgi:ABC-type cobalt transport system substrate-binding protein